VAVACTGADFVAERHRGGAVVAVGEFDADEPVALFDCDVDDAALVTR
jgi:hypothetical protein